MKTVTIYCTWREYHWTAECFVRGACKTYVTQQGTHGSARQAADEILSQLREKYGPAATMRRLSTKVYQVTALEGLE